MFAASDAARIAFELFGRTMTPGAGVAAIASAISPTLGIVRLARLDHGGVLGLENRAVALALDERDDAGFQLDRVTARREARLAGRCLRVHVRDLDLIDDTDGSRRRERSPRIVRMDVHLDRRLVPDDEERIPEAPEHVLEPPGVEIVSLDDEAGAIPVARQLLVHRVDPELRREDGSGRNRRTVRRERRAAHDLDEAGATRVDDSGPPEDFEQLGRPRECLLAPRSRTRVRSSASPGFVAATSSASSAISRIDRENRPLDRPDVAHRAVARVAPGPKRVGERGSAHGVRRTDALREAAKDLREDHARIPPPGAERNVEHLVRELRGAGGGRRLDRLDHAAQREDEVRARVPVRHRIDVQVVDPLPVRLEVLERRTRELGDRRIGHRGEPTTADRRVPPAPVSVRAPSGPCRPSDSACRRRHASPGRRAARGRAAGSG